MQCKKTVKSASSSLRFYIGHPVHLKSDAHMFLGLVWWWRAEPVHSVLLKHTLALHTGCLHLYQHILGDRSMRKEINKRFCCWINREKWNWNLPRQWRYVHSCALLPGKYFWENSVCHHQDKQTVDIQNLTEHVLLSIEGFSFSWDLLIKTTFSPFLRR